MYRTADGKLDTPFTLLIAGVAASLVISCTALGYGVSAYRRGNPVTEKAVVDAMRRTSPFEEGADSSELFFTGYDRGTVSVSIPVGHFVAPDFIEWFGELTSNSSARALEGSIVLVPALDSEGARTWFRMEVPTDPSATGSPTGDGGGGGLSGGGGGTATGMAGP